MKALGLWTTVLITDIEFCGHKEIYDINPFSMLYTVVSIIISHADVHSPKPNFS